MHDKIIKKDQKTFLQIACDIGENPYYVITSSHLGRGLYLFSSPETHKTVYCDMGDNYQTGNQIENVRIVSSKLNHVPGLNSSHPEVRGVGSPFLPLIKSPNSEDGHYTDNTVWNELVQKVNSTLNPKVFVVGHFIDDIQRLLITFPNIFFVVLCNDYTDEALTHTMNFYKPIGFVDLVDLYLLKPNLVLFASGAGTCVDLLSRGTTPITAYYHHHRGGYDYHPNKLSINKLRVGPVIPETPDFQTNMAYNIYHITNDDQSIIIFTQLAKQIQNETNIIEWAKNSSNIQAEIQTETSGLAKQILNKLKTDAEAKAQEDAEAKAQDALSTSDSKSNGSNSGGGAVVGLIALVAAIAQMKQFGNKRRNKPRKSYGGRPRTRRADK